MVIQKPVPNNTKRDQMLRAIQKRGGIRWVEPIKLLKSGTASAQGRQITGKTKFAKVQSKTSSLGKNTFSGNGAIRKWGKLCATVEKKYLCRKSLTPPYGKNFDRSTIDRCFPFGQFTGGSASGHRNGEYTQQRIFFVYRQPPLHHSDQGEGTAIQKHLCHSSSLAGLWTGSRKDHFLPSE